MADLELRVYTRQGEKRFVAFDPERFLAALAALRDVEPGQPANAVLKQAMAAALFYPADPDSYYQPPRYFTLEFLLPDPKENPDAH